MTNTAPFKLKGLDHVVIRCRDLAKMRAFYLDVLGCTVEDDDVGLGLYQMWAGAQMISLAPIDGPMGRSGGPAPGPVGHNVDHIAIMITPFDDGAIRTYLGRHGVKLGDTRIRNGVEGEGPGIYIHDPEGNTIELKGPPDPAFN